MVTQPFSHYMHCIIVSTFFPFYIFMCLFSPCFILPWIFSIVEYNDYIIIIVIIINKLPYVQCVRMVSSRVYVTTVVSTVLWHLTARPVRRDRA
jgi:hypothetical protein